MKFISIIIVIIVIRQQSDDNVCDRQINTFIKRYTSKQPLEIKRNINFLRVGDWLISCKNEKASRTL